MSIILSQANRILGVLSGLLSDVLFSGRTTRAYPPAPGAVRQEPVKPNLNQLTHWCTTGRLDQALLELHSWQRQDHCPPQATLLLTSTLARQGHTQSVLDILSGLKPAIFEAEPALEKLRLTLLIGARQMDQATASATSLAKHHGHETTTAHWLAGFKTCNKASASDIAKDTVAQLAAQLSSQYDLIPSLVKAALLQPVTPEAPDAPNASANAQTHLLAQALHQVSQDCPPQHMLMLCLAIAQLAMHINEPDDARRWAHRGLQLDPYNATLAIILSKVTDSPTLAINTPAILKRAVDEHPDYHDLQAALIRTEHAQGQHDQAQLHLNHWLNRHPHQPLAKQVARELAA